MNGESGAVFQYTRFHTLRGMLGGEYFDTPQQTRCLGSIWVTSSQHLNDTEEFKRGKRCSDLQSIPYLQAPFHTQMRLALRDSGR